MLREQRTAVFPVIRVSAPTKQASQTDEWRRLSGKFRKKSAAESWDCACPRYGEPTAEPTSEENDRRVQSKEFAYGLSCLFRSCPMALPTQAAPRDSPGTWAWPASHGNRVSRSFPWTTPRPDRRPSLKRCGSARAAPHNVALTRDPRRPCEQNVSPDHSPARPAPLPETLWIPGRNPTQCCSGARARATVLAERFPGPFPGQTGAPPCSVVAPRAQPRKRRHETLLERGSSQRATATM